MPTSSRSATEVTRDSSHAPLPVTRLPGLTIVGLGRLSITQTAFPSHSIHGRGDGRRPTRSRSRNGNEMLGRCRSSTALPSRPLQRGRTSLLDTVISGVPRLAYLAKHRHLTGGPALAW